MITLVAARTEPYGLTIVESLQRGIPVIATNSGGPQELLDDSCLYDFDDLDECVRKIRSIIYNYDDASVMAIEKFNKLKKADYIESQRNIINSFIQKAEFIHSHNKSNSGITQKLSQFQALLNGGFQIEKIAYNISKVSKFTKSEMSYEDVLNKISLEKNSSGNAVLEDIKKYDVIPFTYSDGMDSLYKEGFGLAIELAANSEDIARLVMIFYIYSCLIEKVESSKTCLRILALGDGLALDSMRLANCGLNIDYIDYDKSNMAKIAKLNCNQKFGIGQKNIKFIDSITKKYDAIVCLEVIEHVPIPFDFLNKISSHLKIDGLLFISECFDGIEDRWPTHLHANEKYSNKLPFLANQGLELSRINKNPYGKPYVFKKISRKNIDLNNANLYDNKDVLKGLYNAISRIGV